MADLRINGWSDKSLKCQPDLDQLFDTSGEESISVSDCSGGFEITGFMSILVLQSSSLSSWCLVMVVWLFLVVPWGCR